MKKILLMLSLLLVASSSFAMKKADFIKSGFEVIAETDTYIIFKGKDGKDYFVLKQNNQGS